MTDRGRTATVQAPATSANLGPGFDAFGLCLALADEVTATVTGGGLAVTVEGEGAEEIPRDDSHLVVRSMAATFSRLGVPAPAGLAISCINRLPHGRGLGSSAAAIVSGILLAEALSPGVSLARADAVQLAAELEGTALSTVAILPGSVDTDMLKQTPFSPKMSPEEVASVIAYHALDAPRAVTGACVEVFG